MNFDFGDTDGKYKVELENGALNHTANAEASNADITIRLSRETLNNLLLKQTTLDKAIAAGDVKVTGNSDKLKEVLGYLDNFECWFNIVTPDP
ncbi:alkyl sulfatase C-terminal domain-containing protein [Aeromonas aquatica]|uniref:alkyl sulfatase C-terminal domain-containing protein n=1 Tax=Aeromonas aquatica TaxID=558964 RepID=UPI00051B933E|nr:alkyl sulfatase C-terminal domain-containing protein [Aeromonas aquatica]